MTTRLWDLHHPVGSPFNLCSFVSRAILCHLWQDMTTRLWDLRYPATSFAVLKAHIGAIRALRFRCALPLGGCMLAKDACSSRRRLGPSAALQVWIAGPMPESLGLVCTAGYADMLQLSEAL